MTTAAAHQPRLYLRPDSAGLRLMPREFDSAEFAEGWRYELIDGVLVVSPTPLEMERDPNEQLGYWLRLYQETHPEGKCLDKTLPEHTVRTGNQRRRADRVIWIGLGRTPTKKDVPRVIAEFLSAGRRDRRRDLIEKRDEYMAIGVDEYWVFDRFNRTLTVFARRGTRIAKRVLAEAEVYTTPLLRGFELHLSKLFALVADWEAAAE